MLVQKLPQFVPQDRILHYSLEIFPAQSGKLNAPPSHRAADAALQIGMDLSLIHIYALLEIQQ